MLAVFECAIKEDIPMISATLVMATFLFSMLRPSFMNAVLLLACASMAAFNSPITS